MQIGNVYIDVMMYAWCVGGIILTYFLSMLIKNRSKEIIKLNLKGEEKTNSYKVHSTLWKNLSIAIPGIWICVILIITFFFAINMQPEKLSDMGAETVAQQAEEYIPETPEAIVESNENLEKVKEEKREERIIEQKKKSSENFEDFMKANVPQPKTP